MADFLTRAERSSLMSRIRSKNTTIERTIFRELRAAEVYFRRNDRSIPGCPDIVFRSRKIAVFLDGGFWHGYGFDRWGKKLKPFWRNKIVANMKRDRRNRSRLKAAGWTVVKFWQHEVQDDPYLVVLKILSVYSATEPSGRPLQS